MSRLGIEAIAGAVVLAIGLYFGWHFGSLDWKGKYDGLVVSDAQNSADLTASATQQAQAARDTYDTNLKAITDAYHHDTAVADTTADGLSVQLRNYAHQLQICSVPKGGATRSGADDAAGGASGDPELTAAVGGVTEALGRTIKASGHDSTKLTALQNERRSLNQESPR